MFSNVDVTSEYDLNSKAAMFLQSKTRAASFILRVKYVSLFPLLWNVRATLSYVCKVFIMILIIAAGERRTNVKGIEKDSERRSAR